MNTVQDTITCWLSIVTGSCGQVHSRKTHWYINSPINARCGHTVVTLKLFLTVRSCLRSERCLLTIHDKSKNSNSHQCPVVKICSIKGKPKLQEQETEKHICTCTTPQARTVIVVWSRVLNTTNLTLIYRTMVLNPWRESELVCKSVFSQAEAKFVQTEA